jgi:hypothetical protein
MMMYILLNHDYLGNPLKTPVTVISSENIIKFTANHPTIKKDVLYYKDNLNKVYVYYDSISLQYIGYSQDDKLIKKPKNNASLIIDYSLKKNIMLLGYMNQYINLNNIDSNNNDTKNLIIKIVRNRLK